MSTLTGIVNGLSELVVTLWNYVIGAITYITSVATNLVTGMKGLYSIPGTLPTLWVIFPPEFRSFALNIFFVFIGVTCLLAILKKV